MSGSRERQRARQRDEFGIWILTDISIAGAALDAVVALLPLRKRNLDSWEWERKKHERSAARTISTDKIGPKT